tara:strand:+ start:76684 stop:76995 length:312 start_codon:yes stop_codon:yes gene_type:complete
LKRFIFAWHKVRKLRLAYKKEGELKPSMYFSKYHVHGFQIFFMLLTITSLFHFFLPGLPISFNASFLLLALFISAVIGLLSGVVPAAQAANLDPLQALCTRND